MSKYHVYQGEKPEEKVVAHGDDYPSWKCVLESRRSEMPIPHVMQVATSRTVGPSDSRDPNHLHKTMWECYYITSGTARFYVGDEEFDVDPGDYIRVPPNTPHGHVVPEGVVLRMFYFSIATDQ